MKRLFLMLMIFANGFCWLAAQTRMEKRAEKLYQAFAYSEAIPLYQKLIEKNASDYTSLHHLADCFFKTGNKKDAEQVYKALFDDKMASPEEVYNYAQVLKSNRKYAESLPVMQKFYAAKTGDSRGEEYFEKMDFYTMMQQQEPFFSVATIEGNTPGADFSAAYREKKIVFVSDRKNVASIKRVNGFNNASFLDLYVADRDTKNNLINVQPFDNKINSKYNEGALCFSEDGKTLYFTRNNADSETKVKTSNSGKDNLGIYQAKLVDGNWKVTGLSINNNDYSVGDPALSKDGKILYFVSDMPGGTGGTDIYKVALVNDSIAGKIVNVGFPVNTEGDELFPFVQHNGTLFFSSNGHVGFGGMDVFACSPEKDGSFKRILNLGEPLNTNADDFGFVLAADERTGYVSSNREGGKGGDDIYSTTMLRPVKIKYLVKGRATDKYTGEPIPFATIYITDKNGKMVDGNVTDEMGDYEFELRPESWYKMISKKDKYADKAEIFSTNELAAKTKMRKNIQLEKGDPLALLAVITDAKTRLPLEGVTISITDNASNRQLDDYVTPSTGDYKRLLADKKIGDKINYLIKLEKKGYKSKTISFYYDINQPGGIVISDIVNLGMSR